MKTTSYSLYPIFATSGSHRLLWLLLFLLPMVAAAQSSLPKTGTPGLQADYYHGYFDDDQDFFARNAPLVTGRIIDKLDFAEALADNFDVGPVATYYQPGNPDEFSARFRGVLYVATAGTYTFYLGSDDAAYLWLDNRAQPLIGNQDDTHAFREGTADVALTAGFHALRVHYGEHGGSQGLVLSYAGPDMPRQVIPNGVLYTDFQSPIRPVLTRFDATPRNDEVDLLWATMTEQNSQQFVVERSTDGGNTFQDLLQQNGAGTSSGPVTYQAVDDHPIIGLNYYRLRQQRTDHAPVYSPVKAVTIKPVPYSLSIFPIPNNGTFYLRIEPAVRQTAHLRLVDVTGRPVYWADVEMSGVTEQRISPNLPVGLYIMQLTTTHGMLTQKLTLGR